LGSTQLALLALFILIVFNAIFTNNFLTLQTLNVNLTQVATIVIVGVGMTLVIATGGIDLSVGSLMAISGALAPMLFMNPAIPAGLGVALAFTLPVLAAGVGGLFNGVLVTRFGIQPIIATLVLYCLRQTTRDSFSSDFDGDCSCLGRLDYALHRVWTLHRCCR
jgi:galactofuranose transport system permease protein